MKNINKKIIAVIMTMVGMTTFASSALAATNISLNPAVINVNAGQTFIMNISVNPQGSMDYAEKVEIRFPKDMVEVTSFNFAPTWIAMTQSGYDVVDNANGTLVKTAGYPAGINAPIAFGTVSFYAKTAGTALISVGANSLSFQASAQSASSGNSSTVTINPKTFTTTTTPAPAGKATTPAKTTAPDTKGIASTTKITLSQDAAVEGSLDTKNISTKYIAIIVVLSIVIIALISYIVHLKRNNNTI